MTSDNIILLSGHNLTIPVLNALNLPKNTWKLAINRSLTTIAYMDRAYRVHHLDINDLARYSLRKALQGHALWNDTLAVA